MELKHDPLTTETTRPIDQAAEREPRKRPDWIQEVFDKAYQAAIGDLDDEEANILFREHAMDLVTKIDQLTDDRDAVLARLEAAARPDGTIRLEEARKAVG